jgi:hypothetical protein
LGQEDGRLLRRADQRAHVHRVQAELLAVNIHAIIASYN